ncbi:proteinaceous RNase P protein [Dioscorea alata]|uniref:Proteinaceous RNase P protein n=1 Tax=Dioscorea alata TaxID=55571 RepID=A0ACB7W4V2_DIOAL|nr:proteinaceous RNase P protein [Dioscorea alata]
MASSSSSTASSFLPLKPFQPDPFLISSHCLYPSSNGFKFQSLSHFLFGSPSFSLVKPIACKVSDEMPPRDKAYKGITFTMSFPRSIDKRSGQVSSEEMVGVRGGRQRDGSMRLKDEMGDKKGRKFVAGGFLNEKKVKKRKMGNRRKKDKDHHAQVELRLTLDMCSKMGDVMGAISLYDSAVRDGVKLEQYHYNVLLYLCSSAAVGVVHPAKSGSGTSANSSSSSVCDFSEDESEDMSGNGLADEWYNEENEISHREKQGTAIQVSEDVRDYARTRGFEIYERMCLEEIPMNEAALTAVARMALSMGNGDMAFEVVKQMKSLGINPKLRSYGPALFVYCKNGDIEKAFKVEGHMLKSGVCPEEPELEALLRTSVVACRGDKVYYILHKLRTTVRQVSPSTASLIEQWFKSKTATRLGKRKWDRKLVEQAMENGGGGWHGLGWLGKGKWTVKHAQIDCDGVCLGCGEKLLTIDLDPIETEDFARSVASIACKRERHSSFQKFQKWLDYYGPFEAVVDGANVGLFSQRQLSINKVNTVVNAIRQKLPSKKWPLIIIHNKRLTGGWMDEPANEKLLEKWKNADCIYATPTGSNDDWYWLYAAIKCKSLIVTNDEMRDHLFQLLGNDFFPKWKERHQVHFNYRDGRFEFRMPPPCSIVIQESEQGHWHIPVSSKQRMKGEISWLCVTRDTTTPKSSSQKGSQGSNQAGLSSDDQYQQCHRPAEHQHAKKNGKNSHRSKLRQLDSMTSRIETAEKLCGCVIDFQI